uniref:C3HC-type domain-containing protein n=1 Tax=Strongyloides venezuelensis TaxID=75913 RepID=A0A0K0FYQ8_STRVS
MNKSSSCLPPNSNSENSQDEGNIQNTPNSFLKSIKLAQDSADHLDDYILYGTNSFTDSCRKDLDDLRKRLKTYTSKNWKISSLKITPLKCALLGWISISPDYIQCDKCKKCISLKFINGEKKNCLTYHGNIQILKKELKSSHKNFCRNRLLFNYNQLEKCFNMLTQYDIKENEKSFNKCNDITWELVSESLVENDIVSNFLSKHGYYYEEPHIKCAKCFYEVNRKKKNFLDPTIHHKSWCPLLLLNNTYKCHEKIDNNPITTLNRFEVLIRELKNDTLKAIEDKNVTKSKERYYSKKPD